MISNEELNNIIKDCESKGHKVTVKDISYVMLCRCYEDMTTAYKSLFNVDASDKEISDYDKAKSIVFLRKYIDDEYGDNSDITFEENKGYMLKLKSRTEKALAKGTIDIKDGLKILTDISVKLNDKFNIADTTKDQLVVVNTKYNSICEYCNHEIYIPTKEDLMKKYNLIENKK